MRSASVADARPARRGSGSFDREQPRDHPLDIGVDHHRAPAEGDRGDRGGGIGADAGQACAAPPRCPGNAAMLGRHGAGAGEQVAGAGIIAEPGPGGHDLAVVGARPAPRRSASAA